MGGWLGGWLRVRELREGPTPGTPPQARLPPPALPASAPGEGGLRELGEGGVRALGGGGVRALWEGAGSPSRPALPDSAPELAPSRG